MFKQRKVTNAAVLYAEALRDRQEPMLSMLAGNGRGYWLTGAGFEASVSKLAAYLREAGVGLNDTVLIVQPLTIELFVGTLACMRIGAVAVFCDPAAMTSSVKAALNGQNPVGVIAPGFSFWRGPLAAHLRKLPVKISTSLWFPTARGMHALIEAQREGTDALPVDPGEPALITYTRSGGDYPYGAVRSHRVLMHQHAALSGVLQLGEGDYLATNIPGLALNALPTGAAVTLLGAAWNGLSRPGNVERLRQHLLEENTTVLALSSGLAAELAEAAELGDLSGTGIERVLISGPAFPDILEQIEAIVPQARIELLFSDPEADPVAAMRLEDLSAADRLAISIGRGMPVGQILPELEAAILPDEYRLPVGPLTEREFDALRLPEGETGEIVLTGDHVIQKYVAAHTEVERKIRVGTRLWHRTGYAGSLDGQGRLWLAGRCEERIDDDDGVTYPLAIEAAARSRLGLRRLACVDHDSRTILVVENQPDLDVEGLYDVIGITGISSVVILDRLPMDRHDGRKVDYQRLVQMLSSGRDMVRMDFDDADH